MDDEARDTLLRTLDTGMVRLTTLIEEGILRRLNGLEEAQNQSLSLIGGLQAWRQKREKALSRDSGEASGKRLAWARLVAALTAAGAILASCGGLLKVLWDLATG